MNEYVNCDARKAVAQARAEETEEVLLNAGPLTIGDLATFLGTDVSGAHDRLCLVEARGNLRVERPIEEAHRTASYIAQDLFSYASGEDAERDVESLLSTLLESLSDERAVPFTVDQINKDHERMGRILQLVRVLGDGEAVVEVTDPDGFNFRIDGDTVWVAFPDEDED